jgi:hypothetical protein
VKRILKIDKCEFPFTRYENPSYSATIEFSEKACNKKCSPNEECWNVPKGTVLSASIGLNVGIALKDYESDFSSYKIKGVSDLPDSLRYISKEKGVKLTVINYAEATIENLTTYLRDISKEKGEGLKILSNIAIQGVSLYPSAENDKKFKCSQTLSAKN